MLSFGALDLSLNAILVEAAKKILQSRAQVQPVEAEGLSLLEISRSLAWRINRAELRVLPLARVRVAFKGGHQVFQLLLTVHQRLAVIGKWE
jgi:hypothetical protein